MKGSIADAYRQEHKDLIDSIRAGTPIVELRQTADSSLVAIMGRMAAYTGQEITWEQALNSQENLAKWVTNQEQAAGDPVFSWDMPLRVPPVAMPGQTKFV